MTFLQKKVISPDPLRIKASVHYPPLPFWLNFLAQEHSCTVITTLVTEEKTKQKTSTKDYIKWNGLDCSRLGRDQY
ncbi:hypothetical protein [Prochlorococcus sp. MIT 0916]|uniref:hypothetical protein n=1 Tax=Prochlorococcus sp. MIT 0916 TaxID=3082521 RepID=UPI0039B5CAC0